MTVTEFAVTLLRS